MAPFTLANLNALLAQQKAAFDKQLADMAESNERKFA